MELGAENQLTVNVNIPNIFFLFTDYSPSTFNPFWTVDLSILVFCMSSFLYSRVPGECFHLHSILYRNSCTCKHGYGKPSAQYFGKSSFIKLKPTFKL